jgi:Planctomycete cytochrome C
MLSRILPILCILPSAVLFAADAAKPQDAEFFDKNIRPILSERCYKCHSHSADKIKGGLVLDSRDAVLAGGDTGPAVTPGQPEKSLLIEAIGYENSDLQMPPKKGTGKKLSDEQIALLTEWVKMGAP